MELLPEPHRWVFLLAFGTGARLGEVLGLRLEDLDGLAEGCVRIAGQYDGRPLKEDKKGIGRVKFVPAPLDAAEVLAPWLARRRAEGARPGDLVFPGPGGRALARHQVAHQWKKVARALGISVSWHKATRTSAASRWASRGLTAEEIGTALGHHGSEVAQRHYMLYQRRVFDARMTLPVVSAAAGSAPASPSPVPGQTEAPRNPQGMSTHILDSGVHDAP
jgi:integrase